jgi:hypothetical protein
MGFFNEEVYMVQPDGLATPNIEHLVCQLYHMLHGLNKAPGILECILPCSKPIWSWVKSIPISDQTTNLIIILILYVDDIFITRNDKQGVA